MNAYENNLQIRKEKTTIVRIVDVAQFDNANHSIPLCFFIGQTCPKITTDDD